MEYLKIYTLSAEEAKERGETALFRESHRMNVACRMAVETAIRENFDGMRLKGGCEAGVLAAYGRERVEWVLANTLQQNRQDGRFSKSNREWADALPVPATNSFGGDLRQEFVVQSHPAVLDGFVRIVRQGRELEKQQDYGKQGGNVPSDQKQSVAGQLAGAPVPGEGCITKAKEREVR